MFSDLARDLDSLLADLARARAERSDLLADVAPTHRDGAVNLVDYAELRGHDLRDLQDRLLDAGLSPLVGCEVDVEASLRSARAAVAALGGADPALYARRTATA
ncbi:MAG TPA: pyruvate kinase, partial [Propionibacterium sp.]|nr:pyruvate kinase [Propionibacterium sp.]